VICFEIVVLRSTIFFFQFINMVESFKSLISNYQQRLMNLPFAPNSSFGRAVLGDDGTANKLLLTYLFIDMDVGIQFLVDTGLIRR
jgi:hypothetical protein